MVRIYEVNGGIICPAACSKGEKCLNMRKSLLIGMKGVGEDQDKGKEGPGFAQDGGEYGCPHGEGKAGEEG